MQVYNGSNSFSVISLSSFKVISSRPIWSSLSYIPSLSCRACSNSFSFPEAGFVLSRQLQDLMNSSLRQQQNDKRRGSSSSSGTISSALLQSSIADSQSSAKKQYFDLYLQNYSMPGSRSIAFVIDSRAIDRLPSLCRAKASMKQYYEIGYSQHLIAYWMTGRHGLFSKRSTKEEQKRKRAEWEGSELYSFRMSSILQKIRALSYRALLYFCTRAMQHKNKGSEHLSTRQASQNLQKLSSYFCIEWNRMPSAMSLAYLIFACSSLDCSAFSYIFIDFSISLLRQRAQAAQGYTFLRKERSQREFSFSLSYRPSHSANDFAIFSRAVWFFRFIRSLVPSTNKIHSLKDSMFSPILWMRLMWCSASKKLLSSTDILINAFNDLVATPTSFELLRHDSKYTIASCFLPRFQQLIPMQQLTSGCSSPLAMSSMSSLSSWCSILRSSSTTATLPTASSRCLRPLCRTW